MTTGDLTQILGLGFAVSQLAMTILFFVASRDTISRIERLEADARRFREELGRLSLDVSSTYGLGRSLVDWTQLQAEDMENIKGVVDEICAQSQSQKVKKAWNDVEEDDSRRILLSVAQKRIALYSEKPEDVLSCLRGLSQIGSFRDFMRTMGLYISVDSDTNFTFKPRVGWSEEQALAFVDCIQLWAEQIEISARDIRYASRMYPLWLSEPGSL